MYHNNLKISLAFLMMVIAVVTNAQKLPNIQQNSLRIPANVKIDGKATEWGDKFQAHNKAVNLFYTLANDDENLYLIVQATNPRVIEKILDVGVTLTVNSTDIKSNKTPGNVAITYPVMKDRYIHRILINAGDKANWAGLPNPHLFPEALTRTDSTVASANKTFNANATAIGIKGGKGLADTSVSIYNDRSIKAAGLFGNDGVYTYELQIPLTYLGLSINNTQKFSYGIKLSSFDQPMNSNYVVTNPVSGQREDMEGDPDLNSTTDFWGEYTLAKK